MDALERASQQAAEVGRRRDSPCSHAVCEVLELAAFAHPRCGRRRPAGTHGEDEGRYGVGWGAGRERHEGS